MSYGVNPPSVITNTEVRAAAGIVLSKLLITGTPDGTKFLRDDGSWVVPPAGGDVSKVGTPANNQVGVWTGDGTIEGTSSLLFDGTNFGIGGTPTSPLHVFSAGNTVARIQGGAASLGRFIFADNIGDAGYIDYDHTDDSFSFKRAGTEYMALNSGGLCVVAPGNSILRIEGGAGSLSRLIATDNVGDAGYIDYDHSVDAWVFRTAGTERMRITSAGFVDVNGSGASLGQVNIVSDGGAINNLSLMDSRTNATNNGGVINFGGKHTASGYAQWASIAARKLNGVDTDVAGGLLFSTRSVASGFTGILDLTSTKVVDLLQGQLKFPATANPSADANTLDDYEEGTVNLNFAFGGASVGVTYTSQSFKYVKIGKKVDLYGDLRLSAKGSSTGTATITGLPFASATTPLGGSLNIGAIEAITYSGTMAGLVSNATTSVALTETSEAGGITDLTDADFSNTSRIIGHISYITD